MDPYSKNLKRFEGDINGRLSIATQDLLKVAAFPETLTKEGVTPLLQMYFTAKHIIAEINESVVEGLQGKSKKQAVFEAVKAARDNKALAILDIDELSVVRELETLVVAKDLVKIKEFVSLRINVCGETGAQLLNLCKVLATIVSTDFNKIPAAERQALISSLSCPHCANGTCNPVFASRKVIHTPGSESAAKAVERQQAHEARHPRPTPPSA